MQAHVNCIMSCDLMFDISVNIINVCANVEHEDKDMQNFTFFGTARPVGRCSCVISKIHTPFKIFFNLIVLPNTCQDHPNILQQDCRDLKTANSAQQGFRNDSSSSVLSGIEKGLSKVEACRGDTAKALEDIKQAIEYLEQCKSRGALQTGALIEL